MLIPPPALRKEPTVELPLNVEPATDSVPELSIPPPVPALATKPKISPMAELALNKELVTASVPEFSIPPPKLAELSLNVELVTDSVPELSIPPPKADGGKGGGSICSGRLPWPELSIAPSSVASELNQGRRSSCH